LTTGASGVPVLGNGTLTTGVSPTLASTSVGCLPLPPSGSTDTPTPEPLEPELLDELEPFELEPIETGGRLPTETFRSGSAGALAGQIAAATASADRSCRLERCLIPWRSFSRVPPSGAAAPAITEHPSNRQGRAET
jgi:hypothetical protein